jgi:sortase A
MLVPPKRSQTTALRRARKARKRAFAWAALALVLIGAAWWRIWGDSIPAHRAIDTAIAAFRAEYPTLDGIAEWRTDIENVHLLEPNDLSGTWGVLHVPSWAGQVRGQMPIKAGTSDHVLNTGAAGHYPETAAPGEVGNFGLAAHRRTRGNSFRLLPDLAPGVDIVIVEHAAAWLRYEITSHEIVDRTNLDVLLPVPGDPHAAPVEQLMTLTTCHGLTTGEWGNSHRWITYATLTGWIPREDGTPAEVADLRA